MRPKVSVLLSYYNGDKYINEQVESILNQIGDYDLTIFIRDDGSKIPLNLDINDKRIVITYGENVGVKKSFFELIKTSGINDDFTFFCDQDDFWLPDKIKSAIDMLSQHTLMPTLYISDTYVVDENLKIISKGSYEKKAFNFQRTFIKNNAVGCTMAFNRKFKIIAMKFLENYQEVSKSILHDHLLYMLCLGIDGKVVYDNLPHLMYRQHIANVVGDSGSLLSKLKNNGLFNIKRERYGWAKEFQANAENLITVENHEILKTILNYRKSMRTRIALIRKLSVGTNNVTELLWIVLLILSNRY